ncbi:hypothetical protein BKA56DRAFT_580864 [Ilyonectria sp. MPI-CAGE-AT-0026]|nr:hypothetical protein BKA56DRAFT_580864 [Ilyonectria sp. MPI-CAGE-AT-0026]
MSGFEVAGLVLGALPLIVGALESYSKLAKKAGFWRDIRRKYQSFDTHLQCQRLEFIATLRVLLLPLVTAGDNAQIHRLMADPLGDGWKDAEIETRLEKKLQGQYELYTKIVSEIRQIVSDLEQELDMDCTAVREAMAPSTPAGTQDESGTLKKLFSLRRPERQDSRSVAKFKLKFVNGEQTRTTLLGEFERCNKALKTVLNFSDNEAETVAITSKSATDNAICRFYLLAARLFKLLLASWKCTCPEHRVKLRLQHRTTLTESEFRLLFATPKDGYWELQHIRISQGNSVNIEKSSQYMAVGCGPKLQPEHRITIPVKSAMRVRTSTTQQKRVGLLSPPVPAITITSAGTTEATTIQAIHSLCTSLSVHQEPCYGYLHGEDCRYFVYPVSHDKIDTFVPLSLEELLTRTPRLKRLQRLALSLTLASSFLQLFDSPWLPASLGKSDVLFVVDPNDPETFKLDQPHINSSFFKSSSQEQRHAKIKESLTRLGIVLLELCFGEPLEMQGCRKELGISTDAKTSEAMDLAAAVKWLDDVSEEAGPDYAEAISWCLTGIRAIPNSQEWRKQMLLQVLKRLEKCYSDLKGELKEAT